MDARPYPEKFHRRAIDLARLEQKPVSKIAAELGIAQPALHRWLRQSEIDEGERNGLTSEERAELVRLCRANRTLEMENEILKRATLPSSRVKMCSQNELPAGP